MDIRTYEQLIQRVEDARRMYWTGHSKLDQLRNAAADAAIAGQVITEDMRHNIEDAKSDMRIGEELFADAKNQMINAVNRLSL